MSDAADAPSTRKRLRDRSPAARRAARARKAERERRIVDLLDRGVSVAEIAEREGLSMSRMRGVLREVLAQRAPRPPAEFLAVQVARLSEALQISYSSMVDDQSGANFEAIDRVVRIVRELDRYHGFGASAQRREAGPRRLAPERPPARTARLPERFAKGAASD